jgi:transposase InsO family protein
MKKEIIRKEFLKLRIKQYSYLKCKTQLKELYRYEVNIRTLKRWQKRFSKDDSWNLIDNSRKPNKIYCKITEQAKEEIINLRKKTGWGSKRLGRILNHLDLSHFTINQILRAEGLTRKEGNRGTRARYIRFQRKHANSLWHVDDSEFAEKGKIIAVIDDCSRYCLGILHVNSVDTNIVTKFLDELIKKFGKPRQIISDNGSPYGLKSKHSRFDRWCKRNKIDHIRTRVKRPQTNGKVERLFQTIGKEISFCNKDLENFRYRYNQFRPHESLNWQTPSQVFNDFNRNMYW